LRPVQATFWCLDAASLSWQKLGQPTLPKHMATAAAYCLQLLAHPLAARMLSVGANFAVLAAHHAWLPAAALPGLPPREADACAAAVAEAADAELRAPAGGAADRGLQLGKLAALSFVLAACCRHSRLPAPRSASGTGFGLRRRLQLSRALLRHGSDFSSPGGGREPAQLALPSDSGGSTWQTLRRHADILVDHAARALAATALFHLASSSNDGGGSSGKAGSRKPPAEQLAECGVLADLTAVLLHVSGGMHGSAPLPAGFWAAYNALAGGSGAMNKP